MARNSTIEAVSVKPRMQIFNNQLQLDLGEIRDRGYVVQSVAWDADQGVLTVQFRGDGAGAPASPTTNGAGKTGAAKPPPDGDPSVERR